MPTLIDKNESAIAQGIKTIGVGKKGSKPLSKELAAEILNDLKSGNVPQAAQGAFFGALMLKGVTDDEKVLGQFFPTKSFDSPATIINHLSPESPEKIKTLCAALLRGQELTKSEAIELGNFLFSDQPGDALRGLTASVLRVRYETADEYEGLLLSLKNFIEPQFKKPPPAGDPIVQIAEPFDGVDHSNMITPLLADYLQNLNYRVVSIGGRNSGPKFFLNLCDIANALKISQITKNTDFLNTKPRFGFFLDQKNLSKSLDRWVDIRHQTIKRPFLSTIERFVNPFDADVLIASAFHPPYGEKMLTIAERMGFKKIIVVRNGIEGTIAFPLKRSTKLLMSDININQTYTRHEIEFNAEDYFKIHFEVEEKLERPSLQTNTQLINEYYQKQKTGNNLFDFRVKATCIGIKQAINLMNN